MTKKLTPWFSGTVKPARVGVYERDYGQQANPDLGSQYQFWDGVNWLYGASTPESTMRVVAARGPTASQLPSRVERDWRGLAEEPK